MCAPSVFTCPDCGGTVWEFRDGKLIRYHCHVGHAFTIDSLLAHCIGASPKKSQAIILR